MFLYIDTSNQNSVGLLKKTPEYSWVDFQTSDKKASFIQSEIAMILEKNHLSFQDLLGVVYSAGPGSYTGMRVTQGFIGTLQSLELSTDGFYHFELVDQIENSMWLSSAFKNEFFVAENGQTWRLSKESCLKMLEEKSDKKVFSFSGEEILGLATNSIQTVIQQQPALLQIAGGEKDPYYYRPLEEEFKVKK